jgi:hypothetical protein
LLPSPEPLTANLLHRLLVGGAAPQHGSQQAQHTSSRVARRRPAQAARLPPLRQRLLLPRPRPQLHFQQGQQHCHTAQAVQHVARLHGAAQLCASQQRGRQALHRLTNRATAVPGPRPAAPAGIILSRSSRLRAEGQQQLGRLTGHRCTAAAASAAAIATQCQGCRRRWVLIEQPAAFRRAQQR